MLKLPDNESSFWREAYAGGNFPKLKLDHEVDVAVIGGGITGLTAAYLLKKSGLTVAVVEKDTIGGGTTGRTTGKVTSQHGPIYSKLAEQHSERTARMYGEANQAALDQLVKIIKNENIVCDFARDDNYVYTTDDKQARSLRKEADIAAQIGLPASFETNVPLPFGVKAAVRFSSQAKIHAQKYVLGLATAIEGNGSFVFEGSNVIGIRDGEPAKVRTKKATVKAEYVIVATNVPTLPLLARGGYCILEYPTESYIVAGKSKKKLEGMYISPDKENYSILPVTVDGQQRVLVGGGGHISGIRGNKKAHYRKLAKYAEEQLGVEEITHYWSDRDYMAYDSIPLAGKLYPWSKSVYVATAFQKWGLSNGTASAMIIHDLITGTKNKWAETFDSNRSRPIKYIPKVALSYLRGG